MPVDWINGTIHHSQVTIEYPNALHALPGDGYQVHMRRADVQNLIQRDVLLNAIRCRRR
jgi:hypothetical protein